MTANNNNTLQMPLISNITIIYIRSSSSSHSISNYSNSNIVVPAPDETI
jgi:hypothetical protein